MLPLDKATLPAVTFRGLKDRISKRDLLFPPQVELVAKLCFESPELLAFESADKVAALADVSSSTVSRFVNLIGFSSLKDARKIFRDEVLERSKYSRRNWS